MLRYAVGCDITSYFVGELDVNGLRHKHSPKALSALRPLVKSRLEKDHHSGHMFQSSNGSNLGNSTTYARNQSEKGSIFSPIATEMKIPSIRRNVFRKAKIVGHDIVSPKEAGDQKCVIRLRISVKREDNMDSMVGTPLPTSTFVFRVFDSHGNAFERPYNISKCYLSKPRLMTTSTVLPLRRSTSTTRDDIEYEFFISLVPGGKMSSVLAEKTVGRKIMVNGPMASKVSRCVHSVLVSLPRDTSFSPFYIAVPLFQAFFAKANRANTDTHIIDSAGHWHHTWVAAHRLLPQDAQVSKNNSFVVC